MASRAVNRRDPLMFVLLVRRAKYDQQFTGREPKALYERILKAAVEQNRSKNETRVTFEEMGLAAYEWMQEHWDALQPGGFGEANHPDEILVHLLNEALAARESRKAKK